MSRVKLLSFDLDDTLWPCEPTIIKAEEELYSFLKICTPSITQSLSVEQIRNKRLAFLENNTRFKHDLTALRIESLKALAKEFGESDEWVDDAFQIFYDARQNVTLYDDVTETLNDLKNDYRLVAVSNGNADIDKTGVGHWFEFSITASDVGYMKPHPAVFEVLLERSGCAVEEVMHIGDHQHHDIYGATQAGLQSVWLNRAGEPWKHQECAANYEINSLKELPKLLDKLGLKH